MTRQLWADYSRLRLTANCPKIFHRDMLRVEAQECGLLADDAVDARTIPDDVLDELGLTAEEVGQ